MGLAHVFAAVEAQLAANLAALALPVLPPLFHIGADKLDIQDAPFGPANTGRVVWVPLTESIQGPHAQGGDGVRNPRPLRTRHCTVGVHIWGADPTGGGERGADITATEGILGHLVAAMNEVLHGAWQVQGGAWDTGQAAATTLGVVYVLTFEVLVPLTREEDVYAPVATMPITPVITPVVPG